MGLSLMMFYWQRAREDRRRLREATASIRRNRWRADFAPLPARKYTKYMR